MTRPPRIPPSATSGTAAPQQERALRTRTRILEEAAAAFARDGFDGTSLNGIIRASGLTKGAFYFHFPSKDDLALAVFRVKQAELVAGMRAAAEGSTDALERLRAMLLARARLLAGDPSLGCFLRIASDLGTKFGPGSEFAASYEIPLGVLTGLVRDGQAQGVFKENLDPRTAAEAVFAAILGTDELAKVSTGGADLEQRTLGWLSILLAGLASAARESPPRKR